MHILWVKDLSEVRIIPWDASQSKIVRHFWFWPLLGVAAVLLLSRFSRVLKASWNKTRCLTPDRNYWACQTQVKNDLTLTYKKLCAETRGKLRIWLFLTENVMTFFLNADTTSDTVGDEWCVTAVSPLRLSDSERETSKYKSRKAEQLLAVPLFLSKLEVRS